MPAGGKQRLMRFSRRASSSDTYVAASIREMYNTYLNGRTEKEEPWQTKVRWFDNEGPGYVGFSLDLKAVLSSLATVEVTKLDGTPVDNDWIAKSFRGIRWATTLEDNIHARVRSRASVGEYWNCYTTRGWITASTPQLYPAQKNGYGDYEYKYILLRPHDKPSESFLGNSDNALPLLRTPERCINPGNTFSGEATSALRRTLRELECYTLLMQGIINDRKSLAQWAKIAYLGEDDGKWRQDPNFSKSGVPPIIKDFMLLGKDRDLDSPSQIYPTMGPARPEIIDLASPIDPHLIPLLEYLTASFARSVNMPVRAITGEAGNDWSDYQMWESLVTMGIKPDLQAVLDEITVNIWRPGIKKLKELRPDLPLDVSPDLLKLSANLEDVSRVRSNPNEVIQLLTSRVINFDQARKMLNIPDTGKFEFPSELSENEAIEQLINKATRARTGISDKGTEPVQASAPAFEQLSLQAPKTAAIEKNTYKEVKGYRLDDKLNRLELKTWGELNGLLTSEIRSMADRIGKKVVRQLASAKTASAKTQLASFNDLEARRIPFEVDKVILAANGIDLEQTVKEERHLLEQAVIVLFTAANEARNNLLKTDLPDKAAVAASVASYSVMSYLLGHKKLGDDETEISFVPSYIGPDVLAAAGGAEVQGGQVLRTNDMLALKDGRSYIPGFAVGVNVQDFLRRQGKEILWSFQHDHPKIAYPPHVALNGVQFTESTRTSALGGMHPLDHRGCCCYYALVVGE